MNTERLRVLAVAARERRIGCVVIDNRDLVFWEGSECLSKTTQQAKEQLQHWVNEFEPDVVISEQPGTARRKGRKTVRILEEFAVVTKDIPVLGVQIERRRPFRNVFREAEALADEFPDLKGMVPVKPPVWTGREPYNLIFFEALALVRDASLLKRFDDLSSIEGIGF